MDSGKGRAKVPPSLSEGNQKILTKINSGVDTIGRDAVVEEPVKEGWEVVKKPHKLNMVGQGEFDLLTPDVEDKVFTITLCQLLFLTDIFDFLFIRGRHYATRTLGDIQKWRKMLTAQGRECLRVWSRCT